MKKIIFSVLLTIFAISMVFSQTNPKQKVVKKASTAVLLKPPPPPPPPPTPPPPPPLPPSTNNSTGTGNQITLVYSLTAVKANIRTGNDNKEYPSAVRTSLGVRGSKMEYASFVQENLKNEMRSNSNTEFGLEKKRGNLYDANGNLLDINLAVLQTTGFHFRIDYSANFPFDAWKIEGITITLEFRDQNGNLHPSLGQKTITFSNANGFLNGYKGTTTMICNTDGYFNPLSAYIE